mmetsp:Transcript_53834/g.117929  ORF Transcript_53834/g.117929 Transcript_53834/m.117929 type:complete len:89 (+) Transcript_53834:489-755(+)
MAPMIFKVKGLGKLLFMMNRCAACICRLKRLRSAAKVSQTCTSTPIPSPKQHAYTKHDTDHSHRSAVDAGGSGWLPMSVLVVHQMAKA